MCSGGDAGEGRARIPPPFSLLAPLLLSLSRIFMDEGFFKRVLFSAACSRTELLSVLHNALKEKEIFTFQSCLSLTLYARILFTFSLWQSCSRRLTITAQVVSSLVLSFCMRSVWTVLISGNELHQVLREERQILSLIHHPSRPTCQFSLYLRQLCS